ncbi:MAG TPA: hypothetical protein VJX67_07285, partial [Blastocatellia bacterium]|nr:hypothetical protein [Blastocatellia bacterium]
RARLAAEVIHKRIGDDLTLRFDLIGVLSVFSDDNGKWFSEQAPTQARDVRLRIAAAHADREKIERLLREVTALYTCGPAGGGGIRTSVTERLNSVSCFVPRAVAPATVRFLD